MSISSAKLSGKSQALAEAGVRVLSTEIHIDERGDLCELVRATKHSTEISQVYAVRMARGATRGSHYHKRKYEWFAVVNGCVRLDVFDRMTRKAASVQMGASTGVIVVGIPPGVSHRFASMKGEDGAGNGHVPVIIAMTNEEFDPSDPDTFPEPYWQCDYHFEE